MEEWRPEVPNGPQRRLGSSRFRNAPSRFRESVDFGIPMMDSRCTARPVSDPTPAHPRPAGDGQPREQLPLTDLHYYATESRHDA